MYVGKFQSVSPRAVKPAGILKTFAERQKCNLTSRYREQQFPFDTPMWDGGVGKTILASIVYNDASAETPSQEAWCAAVHGVAQSHVGSHVRRY